MPATIWNWPSEQFIAAYTNGNRYAVPTVMINEERYFVIIVVNDRISEFRRLTKEEGQQCRLEFKYHFNGTSKMYAQTEKRREIWRNGKIDVPLSQNNKQ